MSKPSTINPLQGGSLSILDHDRKVYPGAWIGMADDVDGPSPWLRVGGIADGGKARIALDADTRVSGNLGVGRAPEASLDVAADGRVRGSLQVDTKLGVGRAPEAALDVAADGRVRGNVRIDGMLGVGRDPASRPLTVDGNEIHSGGTGAGYSFADRKSTGDPEALDSATAGTRWVMYANERVARLWTNGNGDRLTVNGSGDMHVNGQLTVGKRSLFTMWSKEMAVQNKGRDQYASWKVEYSGVFKEVFGAYAFLGGFSLWSITDPGKFGT